MHTHRLSPGCGSQCVLWLLGGDRCATGLEPGGCCQGPPVTCTVPSTRSGAPFSVLPQLMHGTHGSPRYSTGLPPSQAWASGGRGTVLSLSAPAMPLETGQVMGQADSGTGGPLCVPVATLVPAALGGQAAHPFHGEELEQCHCQSNRKVRFFCLPPAILRPSELSPGASEKALPWVSVVSSVRGVLLPSTLVHSPASGSVHSCV